MTAFARKALTGAVLLSLALLAARCNKDENIPTGSLARPDILKYVSGNQQKATHQQQLPQPFVVQVLDSDNNPVPSHKVRFEVTSSSGTLVGSGVKTQEAVTNSSGMTSAYLVLGADSIHTVSATATGATGGQLQGSPVVFSAYAVSAGDGSGDGTTPQPSTGGFSMTGISLGVDTTGAVGRIFPTPMTVIVLDSLGKGVQGLSVFYSAVSGGGMFDLDTKTTDEYGVASNAVRLGWETGPNVIQATAVLPNGL